MKIKILFFLILTAFILFAIPAEARTCETPRACGNTIGCASIIIKFASYTAFNTWLAVNPYAQWEIIYPGSTYPIIAIFSDNCKFTEQCWDAKGVCTI